MSYCWLGLRNLCTWLYLVHGIKFLEVVYRIGHLKIERCMYSSIVFFFWLTTQCKNIRIEYRCNFLTSTSFAIKLIYNVLKILYHKITSYTVYNNTTMYMYMYMHVLIVGNGSIVKFWASLQTGHTWHTQFVFFWRIINYACAFYVICTCTQIVHVNSPSTVHVCLWILHAHIRMTYMYMYNILTFPPLHTFIWPIIKP